MKRDELKKAIDYYRAKVKEEMAGEKKINGQFIGAPKSHKKDGFGGYNPSETSFFK